VPLASIGCSLEADVRTWSTAKPARTPRRRP